MKSQFSLTQPPWKQYLASASIGLALAFSIALPANVFSAPAAPAAVTQAAAQNVDYIGTDAGYALDLSFPVLVPGWVPAPFGGSPSIDAGGGYYSLYWMNGGGDPTFLQVTGTVGGGLPAGSPYDLNNQLFINATVQGYSAIQDITPAYDAVWWIAGGVLYKVESRNSGTDSLTLANSLIQFSAPSVPEPTPIPVEPTPIPVEPTPEPVVPTPVPSDLPAENSEPVVVDERPVDSPVENAPVVQDEPAVSTNTGDEQSDDPAATSDEFDPEQTETPVVSDGTGDPSPGSDGTGGPQTYVIGGDGTGGTIDVVFPRNTNSGTETP